MIIDRDKFTLFVFVSVPSFLPRIDATVEQTKTRWQEAEIEYLLSRLVKKFTRYHNQQRMLNSESRSRSEETARTDRMLNWFQKLKIALFQYLKIDERTRTRWVGIKRELERLELILQDEVGFPFSLGSFLPESG